MCDSDTYQYKNQGVANNWIILKNNVVGLDWFATIQLNGRLSTPAQKAIMQTMVDSLNKESK